MNTTDVKHVYTEDEKIRAVYALNLCTVSISQIIDYNDQHILDQEYDAILNNLNLEQMPKDDALLVILKKILDVVTYFKISEGDKQMIEKEYQHRMKNAIWTAFPSIGALFTGRWIAMGVALATQVGTGYMNYRRNRAEYTLNKEKAEWELQRSAMEQMNGLLKELFETAWRLAKEYKFLDVHRLTERQIHEYNAILMETQPIKRFEKLAAIKEAFVAYPPFWYQLGSTANSIYHSKSLDMENKTRLDYRDRAIKSFEKYNSLNRFNILRSDIFTSCWALEYIDLLDMASIKDREKAKELAVIAEKHSDNNAYDVLELCAYSYLKIGDHDNAEKVFKKLVYNDYNIPVNANILSFIYIKNLHDPQCATEMLREYEKLKLAVDSRYLLPMPGTGADLKDWSPEWAGKLADGNKVTKSINFKDLNDLIDGSFGLQKENQRDEEETQKKEQRAKEISLKKNKWIMDAFLESYTPNVVQKTVIGVMSQSKVLFTTWGVHCALSLKEVVHFSYSQVDFSQTTIMRKGKGTAFGINLYTKNATSELYLPIEQPEVFLELLQKASKLNAAHRDTEKTIRQMSDEFKLLFSKILLLFCQQNNLDWIEAVRFANDLGLSKNGFQTFIDYAYKKHDDYELIHLLSEFKAILPYPNEERIACSLIQDLIGLISFSNGICRDIPYEVKVRINHVADMLSINKDLLDKLIPVAQIPYRTLKKDITMHEISTITKALAEVSSGFVPTSLLINPLASRSLSADLKKVKFDWSETKDSMKKQLEVIQQSYLSLYHETKQIDGFFSLVLKAAEKTDIGIKDHLHR